MLFLFNGKHINVLGSHIKYLLRQDIFRSFLHGHDYHVTITIEWVIYICRSISYRINLFTTIGK